MIFSKFSGIGDIICTFPAALKLKEQHPKAPLIYHCHRDYSCLPRLAGVTDRTTDYADIGQLAFWYGAFLGGFYEFSSEDDHPENQATKLYIRDFATRFGVYVSGAHPVLRPPSDRINRVTHLISEELGTEGPLVIFHAGPTWPVREWPTDHWRSLAKLFQMNPPVRILQIGSQSQLTQGTHLPNAIPSVASWLDRLSLEETASLLSVADLFVGVDSGMLHLAVSLNVRSVGLWGPTSPRFRFSAEISKFFVVSQVGCQGCHHRAPRLHWITGCPHHIECMKSIGVPEVFQTCEAALASQLPPTSHPKVA